MIRLTLRTLLAYLDDTLPAADARVIGEKLGESPQAQELVDRIRKVTRKRSLSTPPGGADAGAADPNVVAAYLSDDLTTDQVTEFEKTALQSDVLLADAAACHQILTLVLSEQLRVPPTAYRRMYGLVKGREAIPGRAPGRTIPIGGVIAAENGEVDESDMNYLLGTTGYVPQKPAARRVVRWVAAAVLAVGFGVAAWFAWPKAETADAPGGAQAATRRFPSTPPPDLKSEQKPAPDQGVAQPEVKPMPDAPVKPAEPEKPKTEVAPPPAAPRNDRLAVARSDTPDGKVLLAKKGEADPWTRVAKGAEVFASDWLLCPPGYTAKLTLDTGAAVELWGNVFPDLLPIPVNETAVRPHVPPDGFDADLTLRTGRLYLSAGQANKAVVRVRFADEVWDVTLPDNKSEAVIEVVAEPVPAALPEPSKTVAVVQVLKGVATVNVRFKTFPNVPAGELIAWDSKVGKPSDPKKPDGQFGKDSAYFNKVPVYPNTRTAQAMLAALDEFAGRLKSAAAVPAAFAELRAAPAAAPSATYLAGARFSVFGSAAVGDLSAVADALNDIARPDLRVAAVAALRHRLATHPDDADRFRELGRTKLRLSDDAAGSLVQTLKGVADADRTDASVLSRLVDQLTAAEVAQREVALYVLLTDVDPSSRARPALAFDVGSGADVREAAAKAWRKRVDELTKEK